MMKFVIVISTMLLIINTARANETNAITNIMELSGITTNYEKSDNVSIIETYHTSEIDFYIDY
jgi:hypothetical protein